MIVTVAADNNENPGFDMKDPPHTFEVDVPRASRYLEEEEVCILPAHGLSVDLQLCDINSLGSRRLSLPHIMSGISI